MRYVKLVHHGWLSAPNGANTVMNALINSKEKFEKRGIILSSLSPDDFSPRSFSSKEQESSRSIWRARLKRWLKSATRYSSLATALILYITETRPSKRIAKAYLTSNPSCDEIAFFHTLSPCYYFLKYRKHFQHTVVVCHTNGDNLKMVRTYYPSLENSYLYKRMKQREEYVIKNVDRINFVSESSKNLFLKLHPDINPEKVYYIYNGISDEIKAVRTKPKKDIMEICSVASISRRKGQHFIIEALKMFDKDDLPNVHFTFVGDGSDRKGLENEVKGAGLDNYITFAGITQNVDEYLVNSDAFILPSVDEGLPMAILEAMRDSLPVISTKVGGIPEMIEDGYNGLFINPCAEDIYHLLAHLKDYDWGLMGLNARITYEEKFSVDKMVEGYAKLLNF